MKNPINTIAALDAIQAGLNPAHLDRLPLATLAVVCAYIGDRYHGEQTAARDCAVDATRALRDRLAKLPHRRNSPCDIRDDADNAIRGAVAAMVAIALNPDLQ